MVDLNNNAPFGLMPVDVDLSKCHWYYKDASVQIGLNDPVIRVADSVDPTGRYASITRHTTGAAISGVVVGFGIKPGKDYNFLKAGDAGYVLVDDNPNSRFIVQDNGGAVLTATSLGNHIDLIAAVDCNAVTGISKYALDATALANGNTFILVQNENSPVNMIGVAYQRWIVKAALHTEVNNSADNITEI